MSQDYECIGQPAPDAEAAFSRQKGWGGIAGVVPAAEQPIEQLESAEFSRWNQRANRQTLHIPPTAGYGRGSGAYDQTPTAETNPEPLGS